VLYDRDKLSSQAGRSADTFGPGGAGQTIVADTDSSIRAGINWRQEPLERSPKPGYWTVKSILGRDLLDGLPNWMVEPDISRVGVGIPDRPARLKAIGNAIVPQIATLIGQAILNVEIQKH